MSNYPSPDTYRRCVRSSGLTGFNVRVAQTDLYIHAEKDLSEEALKLIHTGRSRIEQHAESDPEFLTSLKPRPDSPLAPSPVKEMLQSGWAANVGPMAAVAGAMAEFVGRGLMPLSPGGIVVENGGDIFLAAASDITVGLFAGESPLSMNLGLLVSKEKTPVGICTSSGTVGHSLSLGRADAATVVAVTSALADAAATALGNRIRRPDEIEPSLNWAMSIPGVTGAVAILGERIGFQGDLELVSIS
jgi:ApbE superfamily uncharacterized protein (UPF0280 family)